MFRILDIIVYNTNKTQIIYLSFGTNKSNSQFHSNRIALGSPWPCLWSYSVQNNIRKDFFTLYWCEVSRHFQQNSDFEILNDWWCKKIRKQKQITFCFTFTDRKRYHWHNYLKTNVLIRLKWRCLLKQQDVRSKSTYSPRQIHIYKILQRRYRVVCQFIPAVI